MKREYLRRAAMRAKNSRVTRWLPATVRRLWAMGFGIGLALLLTAVAFLVFGGWVEDRFPSGEVKRALLPAGQRAVTKPVVDAISLQMERQARRRAEALYQKTGLTLEETIARFLDDRLDLATRRLYARRLAHVGSPEAMATLLKVFRTAPPEQKAFMAQLIGSTGDPTAKALLWPLLNDTDERVALAAVRGLSVRGTPEISAKLAELLADPGRSQAIRAEAALGLGDIGDDGARNALAAAFTKVPEEEVATQILNSLGKFPFPRISELFSQYLAAPDTPATMRIITVEALANSSTEAVPFLLELAGNDADADVRAAAAWAISAHDRVTDLGPALAALTERETDADVRRRLYEALLPQASIPTERLLPTVMAEEDIAARVAGFNAVGSAAGQSPASSIAVAFDQKIVPELVQIATAPNSLNIQMRAVFALRQGQTAAAQTALAMIANSARPQVATAARNGLRTPNG